MPIRRSRSLFSLLLLVLILFGLVLMSQRGTESQGFAHPARHGPSCRLRSTLRGSRCVVRAEALSPLRQAALTGIRNGRAGVVAGVLQVFAFMWLRTAVSYQHRHGGSLRSTLHKLWMQGGLTRLYRGLMPWALLQVPLSKFGDTAFNAAIVALAEVYAPAVPMPLVALLSTMASVVWRVILAPIDTCKVALQTGGGHGWQVLQRKVAREGIGVLWRGWEATWFATATKGYVYFATVNVLMASGRTRFVELPFVGKLGVTAVAACFGDVVANAFRVLKTKKQTSSLPSVGYRQAAKEVIAEAGWRGLLFRGLGTQLLMTVLQGTLFTLVWQTLSNGR